MQSWVAVTGARDKLLENAGRYQRLCEEVERVASESVHINQIDKVLSPSQAPLSPAHVLHPALPYIFYIN
jgi:hypothetical protein